MPSIFVFPFVSPLVRAGALASAGRRAVARHALAVVLGVTAVAGSGGAALARAAADPSADLGPLTQRWLDDAMSRNQASGLPLRMEVSVGSLDSRLRLAPGGRGGPPLPRGARPGGRPRLGLRCVEGQTAWNVYLPVTVKAFGPAWVLTGPVAPGTVLTANDATEAEVEWVENIATVPHIKRGGGESDEDWSKTGTPGRLGADGACQASQKSCQRC